MRPRWRRSTEYLVTFARASRSSSFLQEPLLTCRWRRARESAATERHNRWPYEWHPNDGPTSSPSHGPDLSPPEAQAPVRVPDRVHILGASGSGTSSLGAAMASEYGHRHLDTDDYFWLPTVPPFREKRPRGERLELLRRSIRESNSWVLSGSLCGWGDVLIAEFELIVFSTVPTSVRLARLAAREVERYG